MFTDTVTLFNFHEATGKWYPTVISGVDIKADNASGLSTPGTMDSEDAVILLIQSKRDQTVNTTDGPKTYLGPKAYAKCENPEQHFTFKPEDSFFYEGIWDDLTPVSDDEYDSGFYHEVNNAHDGVFKVKNATFYGLIPHFEIGGR